MEWLTQWSDWIKSNPSYVSIIGCAVILVAGATYVLVNKLRKNPPKKRNRK